MVQKNNIGKGNKNKSLNSTSQPSPSSKIVSKPTENNLKSNIKSSLKYDKIVLIIIALILLSSVFIVRHYSGNPLLFQAESYNHFSTINSYVNLDIHFWELNPLEMSIYLLSLLVNLSTIQKFIFILSPLLALASILLFLNFSENLNFNKFRTFLFVLILVLTPAFTLNFTTLSNYSLIIFLTCLGLSLLSSKRILLKYLSIVPLLLVTFFEGLATFMVLCILVTYYFHSNIFPIIKNQLKSLEINKINNNDKSKSKNHPKNLNGDKSKTVNKETSFWFKSINELVNFEVIKLIIFMLLILVFTNKFFLNIKWVTESFISNQFFNNFISDLGAFSGISIFVLFLAVLGMFSSWKEKGSVLAYLGLIVSLVSYYFNNNAILFVGLITAYFASDFIQWVIDRKWSLNEAKNFTLLLIFLGLLFSSISYVERLNDYSPNQEKLNIISWLEDNHPITDSFEGADKGDVILLSSPENSQYISALSNFKTFSGVSDLEKDNPELWIRVKKQLDRDSYVEGKEIFSLTYPSVLFPLLEEYNIKYIYVDPQLKEEFKDKKGLLFALRNERFKLIHSSGNHEIWEFKEE